MTYPSPWPRCLADVECADPLSLPGIPAALVSSWVAGQVATYNSTVEWRCRDRRYEVRSTLAASPATFPVITSRCLWSRVYRKLAVMEIMLIDTNQYHY